MQTAPGADGNVPTFDQTFQNLVLAQQQSGGGVEETLTLPKFGAPLQAMLMHICEGLASTTLLHL